MYFRNRKQLRVSTEFSINVLAFYNECRPLIGNANMLVLGTSNFQGATIRPIVPGHKHPIVFIVHH